MMHGISARELGELLAECFDAISPDTDAEDAARWKGKLGRLIGAALRCDPDNVLWAVKECESIPLADGGSVNVRDADLVAGPKDAVWHAVETDPSAEPDNGCAMPSDEDRAWAAAEFDDLAHQILPEVADTPPIVTEPTPPKTEGFLCKIPPLDMAALARIRRRASWVKSVIHDAKDNGGRVEILSIFPDPTEKSSLEGYKPLIAGHAKNGCGFEEAIRIEEIQDDLPFLISLPDGIVIDFPGIHAWGTKDEYGILRMKRGKDRRWKAGFEWILPIHDAFLNPLFSDKVRIAVFMKP